MNSFSVILNQLIQFFIMLLIGYLATRKQIMSAKFLSSLSTLIMRVLMPILIFANAMNGTNGTQLMESCPIMFLSLGMYISLIALFYLTAKILRLSGEISRVFQASMIFGNAGFIGIPLIMSIYPQHGAIYITLMSIIDQTFMWTYGLYLTTPKTANANSSSFSLKNFCNPALYAVALAILFLLAGLQLPTAVEHALLSIGYTTTPLSLIYLGGLIYFCNWKPVLLKKELYIGILLKLIAFPLVYFAVTSQFCSNNDMVSTMALISALPTMTIIAMFAQAHSVDPSVGNYALGMVLLTTMASLITLSIVSYFIF